MRDLRIVFMGTPEFAVPSLKILLKNNYNVVAVITAPDKPAGRGLQLKASPVKEVAVEYGIPVLQPIKLKDPEFLEELKAFKPNLQIVVAFRMLPESVWNLPEYGTFNLHASLLPQYRGAAPINWAIINGEAETGITTFFLQHEIDTGDIIFQEKTAIDPDEDVESLYHRLMSLGSDLILKTAEAIKLNQVTPRKQEFTGTLKPAPKIFKENCKIDFGQTSLQVKNFVRGLSPYPAAWTTINDKFFKILRVDIVNKEKPKDSTDLIDTDNKTFLHFYTVNGAIAVKELQMEGKKRMYIEDFFRGNKINQD